ncbi:MAG: GrpB family protein [Chloroflexota bacterium]
MSELGLQRGIVRLVAHQASWKRSFADEKQRLLSAFNNNVLGIEHIGSTAIAGIPAKPILDMLIGVASLAVARDMHTEFESLGYVHRPNPQKTDEELYVRGSEAKRTHYAHVVVHDSETWRNQLCFRDRLRADADLAQTYATLKRRLAKQYADNRGAYTQAKSAFIQRVIGSNL